MALVLKDRVLETCSAPGTGAVTLLGAVTGYQTFSSAIGNANTCYYTIADQNGANWEVGIGTYATSGNTLTRTTVLSSSNAGSTVNFATGTQNVFVTYPSERSVNLSSSALTSGRVTYATTDGLLTDSANMIFDGSTLTTLNTAYTGTFTGGTGVVNLGSGQFYKDASGNVGIGTSSPTSGYGLLQFAGGASGSIISTTDAGLNIAQYNGEAYLISSATLNTGGSWTARATASSAVSPRAGFIAFTTNSGLTSGSVFSPTEQMRIDSSGNVGIGTSSPVTGLSVSKSSGFIQLTDGTIDYRSFVWTGNAAAATGTWSNHPLLFNINSAERMRIDSSGNLLVGTTSNPNSFRAVVAGTIGANGISIVGSNGNISVTNQTSGDSRPAYFANNNASGLPNGSLYVYNINDTNTSAYSGIQFVAGSTVRFIVYGNGAVNATGAYTNISDARIKKDIVDATPKLEDLMKVRVVNYTRIDHENNIKEIGVISQELEQIFPNLIMEIEEKDKDGNVTCPDRKLVKYSVFVPILIKAMQEQQALITNLTTRLTALENK